MKVKSLHIKNFKSIKKVDIELADDDKESDTGILIGSNNVGKSNILDALQLFFNYELKSSELTKEMFYQMQTDKPIEIEVELFRLTDKEKDKYKDYIIKNNDTETIKIIRKIELGSNDRYSYKYYIYKQQPKVEWLQEDKVNGNNIEKWLGEKSDLRINGLDFYKFIKDMYNADRRPTVQQWKDAIKEFIESYKDKIPFEVTSIECDREVRDIIKNEFVCIFIPAISDTTYITNKVLSELINEYINRTITPDDSKIINQNLQNIKNIIEGNYYNKIREDIFKEAKDLNIKDIEGIKLESPYDIYDFIGRYLTKQTQLIINDGLESPIESKGHGIQRPLIMCLLKLYKSDEEDKGKNMLLLIEEPELYLHVGYQQIFYNILYELSNKQNRIQVIYTTHSNYFVNSRHFDEICVVRKSKTNGTYVVQLPGRYLVEDLNKRYPNTNPTVQSIRDRYSRFFDPRTNEGFFADKVVLVEGDSEIYALPILMKIVGYDIAKYNITIIKTNGKDSMDRYYRIFNEFKIPTYIIIDKDNNNNNNHELISLVKEDDNLLGSITGSINNTKLIVGNKIAMFMNKLEDFLIDLIGADKYNEYKEEACKNLGLDSNDDRSKPLKNRSIVEKAVEDDKGKIENNAELKKLVERIKNLEWGGSCLKR